MLQHVNGTAVSVDVRPDEAPTPAAAVVPAFAPTGPMLAYLYAVCRAISEHRSTSNTDICAEIGLSRTTLWTWKHKTAGFNAWIAQAVRIDAAGDIDWELMVARAYREAKGGSIEHMRFLLDIKKLEFGLARGQEQPLSIESRGPQLIFNLPRPSSELGSHTVVVGMKLEG